MVKRVPELTRLPRERAFLVGTEIRSNRNVLSLEDSLSELALLADTAGVDVVGETSQRLERPHPDTYIGSGKVEEIKALVEDSLTNLVIFDEELSPRHLRELEERLGASVRVIDRTALILDIFAQHANTREGSLQVELAQYEYRLPRLTRAWTHLARQAGGGGGRTGSTGGVGLRGPGETQLEVDRREIRRRISNLKNELEKVRAHRSLYRSKRKKSQVPVVAIVGYTNTGKSTFLNTISKAGIYVANQLFATLDPTTRRVNLPGGHIALFTDTVGFIQKLPTQLVAAFQATLEEIADADLLIHLVDITHPNAIAQVNAVQQTLIEIGAGHIPVFTALNKIDRLPNPSSARQLLSDITSTFAISALKGLGIKDLLQSIEDNLYDLKYEISVLIPFQQGHLVSLFYEYGLVTYSSHGENGITIRGTIPGRLLAQFQPFLIKIKKPLQETKDDARNDQVI